MISTQEQNKTTACPPKPGNLILTLDNMCALGNG